MAKRKLNSEQLKNITDSMLESGIINKDMTVHDLMEATARIPIDEVSWTAVIDGDKWVIVMP